MNTNEDYISNQIAVYKNSKTLLEFQDKLKVAPITSYAHIHAGGEKGADGKRVHSLIGILMKDYSKGTGDKAVTVCANISPQEAKFILSRLSAGFQNVCGWIYDPAVGIPEDGIAPGTAFEDLPDDWVCPQCFVGKDEFSPLED